MTLVTSIILSLAVAAFAGRVSDENVIDAATSDNIAHSQWAALNVTVAGRLHALVPFARPCFVDIAPGVGGRTSATACEVIQAGYSNQSVRAGSPAAYQETQWETCQATSQQCLLDFTNVENPAAFNPPDMCSQGSVPIYYIEVHDVKDVQAGFTFSKSTGIPLSIKNTGHDYAGRSSGIGSLALWTHKLNNIAYKQKFIPQGCPSSSVAPLPAVTYGSGVLWGDLYNFAEAKSLTLPGGSGLTVGAGGGFLQGGGHSPVSNIYGLAVDRVLEFEVVVPTGEHLFANDCQNSDLFFALRGGGGGTFGVVMSITTRAFPATQFMTVAAEFPTTVPILSKALNFIVSQSVQWARAGWSGILIPALSGQVSALVFTSTKHGLADGTAFMEPLQNLIQKELNGTFIAVLLPSYLAFLNDFVVNQDPPVGLPLLTSSRLIPATLFDSRPNELVNSILNISQNSAKTVIFANAPFNFKPFPGTSPTSVTPAWRSSIWHVTAGLTFNFNTTLSEKKQTYQDSSHLMTSLRQLTPQSGAYQNEADIHEPNFSQSFWGTNYDALVKIKRKYDPFSLLQCWHCVDWEPQSPRFRCYI